MEALGSQRIKWPYVTHRVRRAEVAKVLPPAPGESPGALVLARVLTIGKHRDLEATNGRKMALFGGDLVAGVLGHRYATDQFEGRAACSGTTGHILGIGGVYGEVVSKNVRMPDPTVVEWVGRLADASGRPLHLSSFRLRGLRTPHGKAPCTVLSVGASMNAGKTTTAAQIIRSLSGAGRRVVAAKITGTACRKDPSLLEDAGALRVLDFTDCGWPSTAGCSRHELLDVARDLRSALLAEEPEFVVYEIADGVAQRETRMLLEDPAFRSTIDAVTFAGPDALSCESGVRRLSALGYNVVAVAGIVANGRLGIAEVEEATGLPCLSGEAVLAGALTPALELARAAA